MLTYRRVDNLEVIGYADAGKIRTVDEGKSTTSYIFMLADGAISWKSAKQSLVTSSTMEAEIVACFEAGAHAKWLRNFISSLRVVDSISRPMRLYCDNMAAVFFTKSTKNSGGVEYVELKFFKIREWVDNGDVYFEHIETKAMTTDPLTKGLGPMDFTRHVANMGLKESFDVIY